MKKVVAIFVALTILLSTVMPTLVSAIEPEKVSNQTMPVQTKKVIIVQQKEKKPSFFSRVISKVTGGIGNFILKANRTLWFYGLTTIGLIKLFEKLEVFDSNDVYRNMISKDYGSFFNSLWFNIKNLSDSVKLVYQSLKKDQINDEEYKTLYDKLCSALDDNSMKTATCQIVDLLNPKENIETNNEDKSTKKISDILKSVSKTQQPVVDAMDYFKIHGTLIWVGFLFGSAIGILGSAVGAFNFGWIYGSIMIPYLWSFKDKNKGDLEILANGVDMADGLWQCGVQNYQCAKDNINIFFNTTIPQFVGNLANN